MFKKKLLIFTTVFCCLALFCGCHDKQYTEIKTEEMLNSTFSIHVYYGDDILVQGTCFCAFDNNILISCAHIFDAYEEGQKIVARNYNGNIEEDLTLVYIDSTYDVAILQTQSYHEKLGTTSDYTFLDTVYLLGNTQGYGLGFKKGIISSPIKNMKLDEEVIGVIQTDISISGGDSGAPLFDSSSKVIGMASFRVTDESGSAVSGMSFFISTQDIEYVYKIYISL